jgi:hypothetical protein
MNSGMSVEKCSYFLKNGVSATNTTITAFDCKVDGFRVVNVCAKPPEAIARADVICAASPGQQTPPSPMHKPRLHPLPPLTPRSHTPQHATRRTDQLKHAY